MQAPTKHELIVNLKRANAPGLTVPALLLARRRGDPMKDYFAAVHLSAYGTKQTYHGEFAHVRFRSEADKPPADGHADPSRYLIRL